MNDKTNKDVFPTEPTDEQLFEFRNADQAAPITMVNLLKFREIAHYEDEGLGHAPALTGQEAYQKYADVATRKFTENGGRVLFLAPTQQVVVGDGDKNDWDMIAIVEYPSRAAYLKGFDSDEYQAAIKHRIAGLERRVLFQCTKSLI